MYTHWHHSINDSIISIDGLVQERRNSAANTLELRLSCINPLTYFTSFLHTEIALVVDIQKLRKSIYQNLEKSKMIFLSDLSHDGKKTFSEMGPSPVNLPVCKRDFKTSGGIATSQLKIPAVPPANRVRHKLRSERLKNINGECFAYVYQSHNKDSWVFFNIPVTQQTGS